MLENFRANVLKSLFSRISFADTFTAKNNKPVPYKYCQAEFSGFFVLVRTVASLTATISSSSVR